MPKPLRKSKIIPRLAVVCDGRELFNTEQAIELLGVSSDKLRQAVARGALFPAKIGPSLVFTRRDLLRWHTRDCEAEIVKGLTEGLHPLDIYLQNPGRYRLELVNSVMLEWAVIAGCWIVEGPRGSYMRWLQRMGLLRVTPRQLRRVIELLLVDPSIAERLRLSLAASAKKSDRITSTAEAPSE